jgi:hypothetical protein
MLHVNFICDGLGCVRKKLTGAVCCWESPPSYKISSSKPWYKIPEIPIEVYARHLQAMYCVIEAKNKTKSTPDESLQAILSGYGGLDEEEMVEEERVYLRRHNISGKLGYLHQNLFGSFPGFKTLPNGHESKLDNADDAETEFWECKNKPSTTCDGASLSVNRNLIAMHEKGKKTALVMIQWPKGKPLPRKKLPEGIKVMSGRQAYARLSGRDDFFDDLNDTLNYTFTHFKTYEALLRGIA